MASIVSDASVSKVIVGVDTHKHIHVAVAINQHGTRLGDRAVSADRGGYAQLEAWAQDLGRVDRFGIEGTGSYGVGLTSYLRRCGHRIVEVNRGDRRSRRSNGKSDATDAEAAARSVLAGTSTAIPKTADGLVEMIRQVTVARDTARKGRTSAIITLKTLVVNAPAELRESLDGLSNRALINRCARFRISTMNSPTASVKHSLRALARRWRHLDAEVRSHDAVLDDLTAQASPTLRDAYSIGADSAAELLIVFGDNPERIRSEAAFAKLCGTCPIPRGALPSSHRTHAISPAHHRLRRSPHRRRPHRKGHHPLPQTVLAREVYQRVMADHRAPQRPVPAP